MQDSLDNAKKLADRFSMVGRSALITGGSLSIGREISVAFAEAGADVAVHYSAQADAAFGRPDAAAETVASLEALGRKATAIEADFGRTGQAANAVNEAQRALGKLDVLVVCASIQYRTPFEEITEPEVDRQIQINFKSTLELIKAALPGMKAAGFGRVLTIGSVNQIVPESVLAVYAALKSAQYNLIVNLAREYAPLGITFNNLSPGLVATERNRWRREDVDAWREIERTCSPMQRAGRPSEVAGAALLLCSEAGSYTTGADLQITGGRHLAWR